MEMPERTKEWFKPFYKIDEGYGLGLEINYWMGVADACVHLKNDKEALAAAKRAEQLTAFLTRPSTSELDEQDQQVLKSDDSEATD